MATPRSISPAQSGKASPRSISHRRANSQPSPSLATITEGAQAAPSPPIPRKSSKRTSQTPSGRISLPRPWSPGHSTTGSARTAPPAYDWVPDESEGVEEGRSPVEDEKLAELRRNRQPRRQRRGGWGRLALIAGIVLLCVIGLAVGLGVGLSVGHNGNKSSSSSGNPSSSPSDNEPPQNFPLGQYSFVTALTTVSTACVSNPATWQCYPFTIYDPSVSSTANTSMATFNWVINNTESTYATTKTTTSTSTTNLTISTIDDPFSLISFFPEPLSYTTTTSNTTSPHYTFTLTSQVKKVIPSPALTASNTAAVCFFNATTFVANIYLRAARDFPASESEANSTSIGGFQQWPYAVQLVQTASGGDNVPNCYEMVDGVPGARITQGMTPEASGEECLCEWRNY